MVSFHTFRVVLLSAFLFVLVDGHCKHPRVRREWRSISAAERASWVNAITVCLAWALSFFAEPGNRSVLPTCRTIQKLRPQLTLLFR